MVFLSLMSSLSLSRSSRNVCNMATSASARLVEASPNRQQEYFRCGPSIRWKKRVGTS